MAGYISPATLERVRAASDIVDVIGAVVPLKKAGANFQALCPFHREKTPSFHVNARKQTFHCFGCHKGGDVFTFVKEYESVDFPEAIKRLADRARIPLEMDQDPGAKDKKRLKDRLLDIHEAITLRWHGALLNEAEAQKARDYLEQRKVTPEAISLFRLGYSTDSWDDLLNWGKSKNYSVEEMVLSGLVGKTKESDRYYGRFRGRLMFPICDEQGRVIAFSGRILPGDVDTRKYVNSAETPLFQKSKTMFGLDKSKRALLDKQFAVVCEGQLDLIACFMAGVHNIVAPQGTSFTADHARILKRYVKEVVLCFDSDGAGQKATVRVLDDLLGSGLAIRVAMVPSPHDPDSFIKEHGAGKFQKLLDEAEGFFDFYLKYLTTIHDVATDKGQQEVVRAMVEAVGKTGDAFLIDRYARKTAAVMGVNSLDAVQSFKKSIITQKHVPRRDEDGTAPFPEDAMEMPPPPNSQELWLLKVLLSQDDLLEWTRMHLELSWIEHRLARQILEARLRRRDGEWMQPAAMLEHLEPLARRLVTEVLGEDRAFKNTDQLVADAVMKLRNMAIDKEMAQLNQQLATADLSNEDSASLLMELSALRTAKKQPLKPMNILEEKALELDEAITAESSMIPSPIPSEQAHPLDEEERYSDRDW